MHSHQDQQLLNSMTEQEKLERIAPEKLAQGDLSSSNTNTGISPRTNTHTMIGGSREYYDYSMEGEGKTQTNQK